MKSALPMNFIDIALGKPSPRVYMVENNEDAISNYDFNAPTETTSNSNQNTEIVGYPVYPSKEITQTTPFIYQLGYTGRMGLDKLNQPYEIVTTIPHIKQSFNDYMNKVREVLCHDLIQNGIPEHNFNPEINLQFARHLYTFNVEDLKIFNYMRYPQIIDNYIVDRMHEVSNIARKTTYIPCKVKGNIELFAAKGKAGMLLFQKYVTATEKYADTLNDLLRLITQYVYSENNPPENLWFTIYGTKNMYGDIDRVLL